MRISGLRIDRFGDWKEFELSGFAGGLNVIYAPPGSDERGLVEFLRAVLFGEDRQAGSHDGDCLLQTGGGAITVRGRSGRWTIARRAVGDRDDGLVVEDEAGNRMGQRHLQELLAGVSGPLFDRVFAPGFTARPDVGKLVDAALAHGFYLATGQGEELRLDELKRELVAQRRRLDEIPDCGGSLNELRRLRARLEREVQSIEGARAGQRSGFGGRARELLSEIEQLEARLEARNRALIDLEAALRGCECGTWDAELPDDLHLHLERLEQSVERLREMIGAPSETPGPGACPYERLRSAVRSALEAMRRDIEGLQKDLAAVLERPERLESLKRQRDELRAEVAGLRRALGQLITRREQLWCEPSTEAADEQLERKRRELERLTQRIAEAEERHALAHSVAALEEEIRSEEALLHESPVLLEASGLLRRMSGGKLCRITIAPDRAVWVSDRHGDRHAYDHLGSAAREQVYLSLCLALVATFARRGTRLPLILGDRLLKANSESVDTLAALLGDFAERGHQVLVLTSQKPLVDALRSLDAPVWKLPAPNAQPEPLRTAEDPEELAAAGDYPAWSMEEFPGELTDRVPFEPVSEPVGASGAACDDAGARHEYFLWEDSPIEDAPSIDSDTAERLRKIGIVLVRDLLRLDIEEAARRLRYAGITARMLRRWRSEALLTCRVPRLRPYDARILVECGIRDPGQLARIDAKELRRRVEAFGATSTGQVLLRSGSTYEFSRIKNWIRAAHAQERRAA